MNEELYPCKACGSPTDWIDNARGGLSPACTNQKCAIYATPIGQIIDWQARAITAECELAELRERTEGVCRWRLTDDDRGWWTGDCGAMWTFTGGNPEENEMAYCPQCGRKLEQVEPEPPEDDNDEYEPEDA